MLEKHAYARGSMRRASGAVDLIQVIRASPEALQLRLSLGLLRFARSDGRLGHVRNPPDRFAIAI